MQRYWSTPVQRARKPLNSNAIRDWPSKPPDLDRRADPGRRRTGHRPLVRRTHPKANIDPGGAGRTGRARREPTAARGIANPTMGRVMTGPRRRLLVDVARTAQPTAVCLAVPRLSTSSRDGEVPTVPRGARRIGRGSDAGCTTRRPVTQVAATFAQRRTRTTAAVLKPRGVVDLIPPLSGR
jgi:hypothetical protein